MKKEIEERTELFTADVTANAVMVIKDAILQSQQKALKAVNQEQLALYYGIGRFISENTRNKNWGKGVIEAISEQLKKELPGLKGFSAPSLRKMRTFYEEWRMLSNNSFAETNKLVKSETNSFVATNKLPMPHFTMDADFPIVAEAMKEMKYVNMFNQGIKSGCRICCVRMATKRRSLMCLS